MTTSASTPRSTVPTKAALTHADGSIAEQRVSNLVGDRLCISCGYNLVGQPVLREPHYQMLIVRCPECATVASVQEYPLLGRWANRWAAMLAALWLLVMLALWIGSGAAIFGLSYGASDVAAQKYRYFLGNEFQEWIQNHQPATTQGRFSWTTNDYQAWTASQDFQALFQRAGGWTGAVDWTALWVWAALLIAGFVIGCIWSVALFGRRRPALLIWGIVIMAVALAFSTISFAEWYLRDRMWGWHAAERAICPTVMVLSLGIGAAALATGLMCGRSCVRGLVRALLPPRLRSSLAFLWITDSLPGP